MTKNQKKEFYPDITLETAKKSEWQNIIGKKKSDTIHSIHSAFSIIAPDTRSITPSVWHLGKSNR